MTAPGAAASRRLAAAGLQVGGFLAPALYDRLVPPAWRTTEILPETLTVWVLASGGPEFARGALAAPGAPRHPLDSRLRDVVQRATGLLRPERARPLFYWERRGGEFADFVALAEAAGLGVRSRLGLLLHPVFGPWWAVRALVLTTLAVAPSAPLAAFDPCTHCAAPCASACPGDALASGDLDVAACAATRLRDAACEDRCAARRACPVGAEHAYPSELETHHARASLEFLRDGRVDSPTF